MHILGSSEACSRDWNTLIDIAETNTCRLVNVDNVRVLAPPILIVDSCVSIFINQTRSIFLEHSNHARSARTACEP